MKKIKQITYYLWGIVISLTFSTSLMAQVTIGSNLSTNNGSLLDMKEYASDATNTNATKGMMLPRVKLERPKQLLGYPDETSAPASENTLHAGLTVYNVNRNSYFCPGVYTWNGKEWIEIFSQKRAYSFEAPDYNSPNSYILTPGQKIKVPIGKAIAVWQQYSDSISAGLIQEAYCDNPEAILLWQDNANLIANVGQGTATNIKRETFTINDPVLGVITVSDDDPANWSLPIVDGDSILVETTAGQYGSAYIAVSIGGEFRWSWHIWVPAHGIRSVDMPTGRAGVNLSWMNMNLGATYDNTAGGANNGCFGFHYQWGRKDPFPGTVEAVAADLGIVGGDMGATMTMKPIYGFRPYIRTDTDASDLRSQNLRNSIYNPNTILPSPVGSTSNDWYGGSKGGVWQNRWDTTGVEKSPFDPCPHGWRVPAGRVAGMAASESDFSPWGDVKWNTTNFVADVITAGANAAGLPTTTPHWNNVSDRTKARGRRHATENLFFPAAGRRNYQSSWYTTVGNWGYYHTSRSTFYPIDTAVKSSTFNMGEVRLEAVATNQPAAALSVRCVRCPIVGGVPQCNTANNAPEPKPY